MLNTNGLYQPGLNLPFMPGTRNWALKLGSASEILRGPECVSHVSAYLTITEKCFLLLESLC